ncbi:Virulence protein (plasmid) [Legionella adelaidensis]|uniref:Fic/DOC family protein n=1 Tax=Legionella adelaidensis TaxID=45056 RepID=A0A0W0R1D6_9GAMM|nr:RhuM family protein [Legionella adelaidensis]KTC64902.1 Fic/DOC family protein [Legionella adelaidensis]VEH85838.1 Virulence protein [Legionella adelaidensis]
MVKNTLIYQTEDGGLKTDVTLHDDTVWLSQKQLAELFNKDIRTINEHIQNIFSEEELSTESTIRNFRIVRQEGKRQVTRDIEHYNLDVIISVGYRVKSKEGTKFRIWANKILKDYLVKGYTLDQKRLKHQLQQLQELQKTLSIFQATESKELNQSEATGLLNVLMNYTNTFILLNQYDTGNFPEGGLNQNITVEITLSEAMKAITELRQKLMEQNEATELFGKPKDESFAGILGNIVQSFGGEYLYPSIEEQAAHLLYFIIKNHPFTDGNKRIGAFMFIWFLQMNKHHLKQNGEAKINDNALVAIALLVAQSEPSQKETMIKLIINLIKDVN